MLVSDVPGSEIYIMASERLSERMKFWSTMGRTIARVRKRMKQKRERIEQILSFRRVQSIFFVLRLVC